MANANIQPITQNKKGTKTMTSLFDPFSGVPEISDVLRCTPCHGAGHKEIEPGQLIYCTECLDQDRCSECTSLVFWDSKAGCYLACELCGFQTKEDLLAQVQYRAGQSIPDDWQFDLRMAGETVLAISPNGYAGVEDINADLIAEIIGQLQAFIGKAEPAFA